jgi:DNA transposition AAA+ family ATPase
MDKVRIKNSLKEKLDARGLSGNKASKLIGISSANVSNVLNDKWDNISDDIWRKIEAFCGLAGEWKAAKTGNMAKIYALSNDAQQNSIALAFSFMPGSGKSFALQYYKNNTPNVAYIECDEYWSKKTFITKIAESLGITINSKFYLPQMVEQIVEELQSLKTPLIIIDEADKLKDPVLNLFKTLFNRTLRQCGFILCGAPHFKSKIESGVAKQKQAYQEIYSRIGGEFITLNPTTAKDVREVCKANGITDSEVMEYAVRKAKGDLRQVARIVHKHMKNNINYGN